MIIAILQEQRWSRLDPSIRLAPLACINQNWQAAVERLIWNQVVIQTSADFQSEEFHLFQQFVEGPSRMPRRNLIRTLSLSWHHGASQEDHGTKNSDAVPESNSKAQSKDSASVSDDPWDFPEPISCEVEQSLEMNTGDRPEPDWDKINAMISDEDSDSEPEEDLSGHRSESDPEINGDTDDDEAVPGGEEDGEDITVNINTNDQEEATWENINAMISSDESDTEEPQGPEEVRKNLVEQLQRQQNPLISCVKDIWTYLARWDDSLNIKRINLQLAGNAFNAKMYAGLRHDGECIVEFLKTTSELEIDLPSLAHVEEVFVDGRRALALWPAVIAAKIATASNPPIPI